MHCGHIRVNQGAPKNYCSKNFDLRETVRVFEHLRTILSLWNRKQMLREEKSILWGKLSWWWNWGHLSCFFIKSPLKNQRGPMNTVKSGPADRPKVSTCFFLRKLGFGWASQALATAGIGGVEE